MAQEDTIYVQQPADKNELLKLLTNVPKEILAVSYDAVIWLDNLKRIAENLK